MGKYILRRVLEMIPTTLGILILTFILFYVVGGSPAHTVLGQHATQEAIAAFDAQYGYDKPLFFGHWYTIDALLPNHTLAFSLGPGTYRFRDVSRVHLLNSETGERQTLLKQNRVTVAPGWKLVSLEGSPTRIQRETNGFFDSQFTHYMSGLMRLDFGMSVDAKRPVTEVLKEGVGPSLSLTIPILVFGSLTSIIFGLLCAASRGGWLDRFILTGSTLLMSVNYVVWILLGQFLLGFKFGCFPIWGYESAYYLVLPVLIGIISGLGPDIRYYRAAVLDEIYKPYVRTAQAKGLSHTTLLFKHVLRNSLIPIVTYISLGIPYLFTGSLLLESFFGIPGLGSVSLNSIQTSDMSVVRGLVIIGALIYQFVNLLTDICYGWLDPRVRIIGG